MNQNNPEAKWSYWLSGELKNTYTIRDEITRSVSPRKNYQADVLESQRNLTRKGFQRLHAWAHMFGHEKADGIFWGHQFLNNDIQSHTIENEIKQIQRSKRPGVKLFLTVEVTRHKFVYNHTPFLESVTYRLEGIIPGDRARTLYEVTIGQKLSNSEMKALVDGKPVEFKPTPRRFPIETSTPTMDVVDRERYLKPLGAKSKSKGKGTQRATLATPNDHLGNKGVSDAQKKLGNKSLPAESDKISADSDKTKKTKIAGREKKNLSAEERKEQKKTKAGELRKKHGKSAERAKEQKAESEAKRKKRKKKTRKEKIEEQKIKAEQKKKSASESPPEPKKKPSSKLPTNQAAGEGDPQKTSSKSTENKGTGSESKKLGNNGVSRDKPKVGTKPNKTSKAVRIAMHKMQKLKSKASQDFKRLRTKTEKLSERMPKSYKHFAKNLGMNYGAGKLNSLVMQAIKGMPSAKFKVTKQSAEEYLSDPATFKSISIASMLAKHDIKGFTENLVSQDYLVHLETGVWFDNIKNKADQDFNSISKEVWRYNEDIEIMEDVIDELDDHINGLNIIKKNLSDALKHEKEAKVAVEGIENMLAMLESGVGVSGMFYIMEVDLMTQEEIRDILYSLIYNIKKTFEDVNKMDKIVDNLLQKDSLLLEKMKYFLADLTILQKDLLLLEHQRYKVEDSLLPLRRRSF
ncbi:MAG: hypothetical protein BBJ57_10720 [Desulfobacterales bacterium PC51MH44]|nr:MAG: hypothetical protein BBJ57_10720 [Desulfobacterales bacterium PC51MH44]